MPPSKNNYDFFVVLIIKDHYLNKISQGEKGNDHLFNKYCLEPSMCQELSKIYGQKYELADDVRVGKTYQ